MTREEKIEELIECEIDQFKTRDYHQLLMGGIVGYKDCTDYEINQMYEALKE